MSALRTLVERLSRGRRLQRRLPQEFGRRPIIVSPDAALRWLKPGEAAFDPEVTDAVRALVRRGDLVWDFGANVGLFALASAARSGRPALCIEADPFLADLLRRTATLPANRDLKLDVLCAAVGDRPRTAEFAIAGRGRASSGLAEGSLSTQHGASRAMLLTPVLTADALLHGREAPTLVKVDVEGGEGLFVDGAERLIREVRPRFYIEVSDAQRDKVLSRFRDAAYDLFALGADGLVPVAPESPPRNFVCMPRAGG